METITFDELPAAVSNLTFEISEIKRLLLLKETTLQPETEILLTVQEAAKFLSLSVPTIYGLVHRAEIPVNKRGKRLYFSRQELTAWIKAGRKKTNDEISKEAESYLEKSKIKR
jgi:excisionase family DNA binding protein